MPHSPPASHQTQRDFAARPRFLTVSTTLGVTVRVSLLFGTVSGSGGTETAQGNRERHALLWHGLMSPGPFAVVTASKPIGEAPYKSRFCFQSPSRAGSPHQLLGEEICSSIESCTELNALFFFSPLPSQKGSDKRGLFCCRCSTGKGKAIKVRTANLSPAQALLRARSPGLRVAGAGPAAIRQHRLRSMEW